MSEYNVGDIIEFKDINTDNVFIGEILAIYEHNGLIEVSVDELVKGVETGVLPEHGTTEKELIRNKY